MAQVPAPLELLGLEAALGRVVDEGLVQLRALHVASAAASRAGAHLLGLEALAKDGEAASVVTTLAAPTGLDPKELVERARSGRQVAVSAGLGELSAAVVRIDHTGRRARLDVVLDALGALGVVLFESVACAARSRTPSPLPRPPSGGRLGVKRPAARA